MKRRRALVLALLMLATLCVSPVAFAEEESSAEEYLRLGVVAERVERDPDKAAVLYLRAMAGGDAPVAAEAGWRMARLQERMGVPSAALETLRSIQARFGDAMTPERVQAVETAIARLEAPEVTPTTVGSPLEIKLRAMFDRVEMASGDAALSEMNFVRTGLESVGKAALPLLEKMTLERTPKTATLAAEMYATIGGADAIEGLERMAIAADPLTRPLVVQAFYELPNDGETSLRIVAAVDRLLQHPELAEHGDTLRDIVIAYRTTESLLARHRAGGPHALFWLEQALDYEEDGAVERAAKLVRAGGEMGQASFLLLSQKPTSAWLPLLGIDGAWSALRAVTELPQDRRDHYAVYDLPDLVRYLEENGGPEAGAEARRLVWEFFATTESPDRRHSHLEKFRKQAFTPPPAFEGHELVWHRLLEGNLSIGKSNEVRDYVRLLTEMGEPFFDALFAVFPDLWPGSRARILRYLAEVYAEGDEGGDLPPPAYDAAWLAFLSSPLFLEGQLPVLAFHIRAALRSGDERTSAILRRYVAARGWRGFTPEDALFRALLDWEHPDRIDFLEAFLDDPDLPPTHGRNPLDLLATAEDAPARELLIRIARDTKHRHAFAAVSALTRLRKRDEIVAIFAHLEEPWEGLPGSYRHALIYAAQSFQLREAIPFLLEEFRRGGNNATSAAKAMDSIRAYHDRLQAFEAYADGREDVRSAELERLLGLLEDEDPELRRAAVLALAAMGRTDALPRILALAKDDPDERVRQAALDAVEKMAR